jgi:alginate O-acetyltransferase complex protein AlgI
MPESAGETGMAEKPGARSVTAYLPLVALTVLAISFGHRFEPWQFMWLLASAIFAGLKWLTWSKARHRIRHPAWRSFAYLFAWPGMDAESFLDPTVVVPFPTFRQWITAFFKTASGALLFWGLARRLPSEMPALRGWVGMIGLVLVLHFGTFHLLALLWQRARVMAKPLMDNPLHATSLAEFWGKRWNIGFRQFAHELVFQPLYRRIGVGAAGFLVFVLSGVIHDLVISVPSRAGWGLPTCYFVLQGLGAQWERSRFGARLGLRRGWRGWIFTAAVAGIPAYWLFHPWFVSRVILPFMQATHAL